MRRFYLATRKDRSAEAKAIEEKLRVHGWERTFAWTGQDGDTAESYTETAVAELAGIQQADVLIVLLPGGYGTHVEIGAALALGKPVILHSPDRETLETPYPCVFHYHPGVKLIISSGLEVNDLLTALRG